MPDEFGPEQDQPGQETKITNKSKLIAALVGAVVLIAAVIVFLLLNSKSDDNLQTVKGDAEIPIEWILGPPVIEESTDSEIEIALQNFPDGTQTSSFFSYGLTAEDLENFYIKEFSKDGWTVAFNQTNSVPEISIQESVPGFPIQKVDNEKIIQGFHKDSNQRVEVSFLVLLATESGSDDFQALPIAVTILSWK